MTTTTSTTSTSTSTSTSTTSTTPPPLTYIFDGFEDGTLTSWDGSDYASVVHDPKYTDSHAAELDNTESLTSEQYILRNALFTSIYARFMFRIHDLPMSGWMKNLFVIVNDENYLIYVSLYYDGRDYCIVINDEFEGEWDGSGVDALIHEFLPDAWHELYVYMYPRDDDGYYYYIRAFIDQVSETSMWSFSQFDVPYWTAYAIAGADDQFFGVM